VGSTLGEGMARVLVELSAEVEGTGTALGAALASWKLDFGAALVSWKLDFGAAAGATNFLASTALIFGATAFFTAGAFSLVVAFLLGTLVAAVFAGACFPGAACFSGAC
jgi:hypothetical protein